jgi:hypothetical protein
MGYAVQNPETPYVLFLILALLCGFGGGNFASSMANISFFCNFSISQCNVLDSQSSMGYISTHASYPVSPRSNNYVG